MTKTTLTFVCAAGLLGIAFLSRTWAQQKPATPAKIVRITLPEYQPTLPDAPGRDAVLVNCGICHTPQYILNQPTFSRATWEAEVTKMRTAFKAPVPEEKVPEILDYLTAVRGAPPQ